MGTKQEHHAPKPFAAPVARDLEEEAIDSLRDYLPASTVNHMQRRRVQRKKFFIDFVGEKVHKVAEAKQRREEEARQRLEKEGIIDAPADLTDATDATAEGASIDSRVTRDKTMQSIDYIDTGEVDKRGGERPIIYNYFDKFMKERYYDMATEALSFEDFYLMSEQFFPHGGLPVLFRDLLYNLTGYAYAVGESPEDTLAFYSRLVADHTHYIKRKEDMQYYIEQGCHPDCLDLAALMYVRKEGTGSRTRKDSTAKSKSKQYLD